MKLYRISFEGSHYQWQVVTDDLVEGYYQMAKTLVQWCNDVPTADPEYFGLPTDAYRAMMPVELADWAGSYLMTEALTLNEVEQR